MTAKNGFKTGVLWQDFQHQQLIDLLAQLRKARQDKTDADIFNYTVGFLAMYVNHHFKLEEEYMKKFEFEDRENHKEEHRKLIKTIKDFRTEHKNYSPQAIDALIDNMKEWIITHIMKSDLKLGAFIIDREKHGSN